MNRFDLPADVVNVVGVLAIGAILKEINITDKFIYIAIPLASLIYSSILFFIKAIWLFFYYSSLKMHFIDD